MPKTASAHSSRPGCRWLTAEYAVMASSNTEASSNGNTVTPVTGPEVANTRRNAAGSIPRQPGTITVWADQGAAGERRGDGNRGRIDDTGGASVRGKPTRTRNRIRGHGHGRHCRSSSPPARRCRVSSSHRQGQFATTIERLSLLDEAMVQRQAPQPGTRASYRRTPAAQPVAASSSAQAGSQTAAADQAAQPALVVKRSSFASLCPRCDRHTKVTSRLPTRSSTWRAHAPAS